MRDRPPAIRELVVDVAAVAREQREPRTGPAQDRDRRVGERESDEQRERDPRGGALPVQRGRREQRQHGADEVGAAVAEIDAGGRAVVHEEAEERTAKGERRIADDPSEHGERERGGRDDAGRQRVHAVEQVHRVHEHDDGRRGEEHTDRPRRGDDEPGRDADRALSEQSQLRRDAPHVVGDAERGRERERPDPRGVIRGERGRDGDEDGGPTEIRDRLALHLQRTRPVEDPERERDTPGDGRHHQRDGERDRERHDVALTSTCDCTSAWISICWVGAKPQRS